VIVNQIRGAEVYDEKKDSVNLDVGAGEVWDHLVATTVDNGWSGIEFLSLIPGTVGAAPVQNIGAYGAEIADILVSVKVYDTKEKKFSTLSKEDCGFAYRSSRFKTIYKSRYIITGITLKLSTSPPTPPFYEALEKYFMERNINKYTPSSIREAVIAIRASKLPDPAKVANNGSFFTNPFVSQVQYEQLKQRYPGIKGWPKDGHVKLAAGWLVEKAGFRGFRDEQTGMATWPAQALVLVNEHAKSTADLLAFKQKIVGKVQEMFDVTLEQEPELLP
jgi:UDP-N-acetylmuramate dehydrogenase